MAEEFEPYGYFGSFQELDESIENRRTTGKSLGGSAVVLLGAAIIKTEKEIRLENPDGTYPYIELNIGLTGKYSHPLKPEVFVQPQALADV